MPCGGSPRSGISPGTPARRRGVCYATTYGGKHDPVSGGAARRCCDMRRPHSTKQGGDTMAVGSASWSFTEDDYGAITQTLQRFLYESNARCALLVDRTGQLVATVGDQPAFD